MGKRLRIGVIGGGLIAQSEHIPNLIKLPDLFELVGVCDPSKTNREYIGTRHNLQVFPDSDALQNMSLDAVLIASPDFTHVEETLKALSRGLHVFCEKPLCYGRSEADLIIDARDTVGKIVQVGYMKRHDPNYEACLELLPSSPETFRYLSVEVNDPGAWPFLEMHPHTTGSDVPQHLIDSGIAAQKIQIEQALGSNVDPLIFRGFASAYCASLIHDVNACHGILERMGVTSGEISNAEIFADGGGGLGTVRLLGGQAVWQMTHLAVPRLADYRERISIYFDDQIIELNFPSPMLNNFPTQLVIRKSDGLRLETTEIRAGFSEAFSLELVAFWRSIVEGSSIRNTVEQARKDQILLCGLADYLIRRGKSAGNSVVVGSD